MTYNEINLSKEIEDVFSRSIYKRIGLKEDPFVVDPPNKVNLFVDREEPFNKLLRSVRNMLEGFQPHIGILGSHGIGKTHFAEYSYEVLKMNKEKISVDEIFYIKGKKAFVDLFLKSGIENSAPANYRKTNPKGKILIFFDDLDVIFRRYPKEFSTLFDLFSGCIIGTWDTYAWSALKINAEFKIPKTDAIYLDRLEEKYLVELLNRRLGDVWLDDKAGKVFPAFVLERLAIISAGNPYTLITYGKRYLDFILDNQLLEIDEKTFVKFCDKINIKFIEDIKKEIEHLSDKQKSMLDYIMEYSEVSAQEVSTKFNMTRVAAMFNLKQLKEKKLLDSKYKNRTNFYYVPTEFVFEVTDYLEKLKEENPKGEI